MDWQGSLHRTVWKIKKPLIAGIRQIRGRIRFFWPPLPNEPQPRSRRGNRKNAFGNLASLQKLHIPSSVKVIHGNPFSYDATLSSITVDAENTVFDSRNACNAIINSTTNVAISCCPETQLPEGVTGLGEDALTFGGASKMFTLNLPSTLTFIAKSYLPRMDKVVIPNLRQWFNIRFGINPLRSAHRLFVQDEEVTEVEVPEDVEALNSSCFDGMSNLKSVKLHRGIKDIGGNAFQGCNALKTLECSWKIRHKSSSRYSTTTTITPSPYSSPSDAQPITNKYRPGACSSKSMK